MPLIAGRIEFVSCFYFLDSKYRAAY